MSRGGEEKEGGRSVKTLGVEESDVYEGNDVVEEKVVVVVVLEPLELLALLLLPLFDDGTLTPHSSSRLLRFTHKHSVASAATEAARSW